MSDDDSADNVVAEVVSLDAHKAALAEIEAVRAEADTLRQSLSDKDVELQESVNSAQQLDADRQSATQRADAAESRADRQAQTITELQARWQREQAPAAHVVFVDDATGRVMSTWMGDADNVPSARPGTSAIAVSDGRDMSRMRWTGSAFEEVKN